MSVIANITTSVDGYITGPDDGPGKGLGEGGERLHYWVFGGQWSYETRLERLAHHVGAAHDAHVLLARRLLRPRDGLLHSGHEVEVTALRLLLGAVGHDEERQAPRVLVAPVARSLVGRPPADHGADPRAYLVQPVGVITGRLAPRLVL